VREATDARPRSKRIADMAMQLDWISDEGYVCSADAIREKTAGLGRAL
jgi:hypothetical protein